MPETPFNLKPWDVAIIAAYFLFIIWWGLRNSKSSNSKDYFLAGRNKKWYAVGLSLFAASISSSTLIGQSGDTYSTGIAVYNYNLISVLVLVFFAWFFLPFYLRSGVFTMPEFLERRFDRRAKYYFSALTILGAIFLDAASTLYAGALVMQRILPEASVPVLIFALAFAAASYTIPGGLSSAISAELVQAVVLVIGSVILTWLAMSRVGSWATLQARFAGTEMLHLIRPLDDASVPWLGLIVGIPILGFYFWCSNQTLVQRVLSADSIDQGRKGVLLTGFLTVATFFIIVFPAMLAKVAFPDLPKPDMVYPTMLLEWMPVGLLGVIIAALLVAITSTLSAILNSASTLFTLDFYAAYKPAASSRELVRVGKITAVVIVLIASLWAPNIGKFGSLVKYYQEMHSYIAPPVVAAFFLGLFYKRANGTGVFAGLMGGLLIAGLLIFYKTTVFGNLHFLLVTPFVFLAAASIMVVVSHLTAPPPPLKTDAYTYSGEILRQDLAALKTVRWHHSFYFWSALLVGVCLAMLAIF
ncbi:sodium:solute symporter [Hymenobacter armeniacus]|uniref:Sodium/solute symporter n=1 Tax=Hymenobacter armeniacus TaxID=2771358 RepID=A0ABR8JT03_9BACT|nr:sodium:solute symporter [Hymenobacter armeniacus]MBD2723112.1 sodium/solute symporter [Hymenobacter armeniacus]